jgi:hypothetical protein
MSGTIDLFPNAPSWHGAGLKSTGTTLPIPLYITSYIDLFCMSVKLGFSPYVKQRRMGCIRTGC